MAKYTIELYKIWEDYPLTYSREEVEGWFKDYNIQEYLTNEQIESIEKQGTWNKDRLAKKIVDHYYMREIGFETPKLFSHYAKVTMQEIMEEKLQYLYANSLKYDPLSTIDYTETFEMETEGEAENKGNSKSNSNSNSSGLNIDSGTPQGLIIKEAILEGKYASKTGANQNEAKITDDTETEATGKSKSKEKWTRRKFGDDAVLTTNQYLVNQYRKIVRAVDKEIIQELNQLFMGLY